MRFGQVGFGSMGKRRVRDLTAEGHEVVVFDERPERREQAAQDHGIATYETFDDLVASGLDALVLSTPPDTHVAMIERAFDAGLSFFLEASIEVPPADWMAGMEARHGVRGVPSATWRFHPLARELRARVADRTVISVHHHYAGYLPAWHAGESYSDYYAGRSLDTCAAREMVPFELDMLTWVFGPVTTVSADRRRALEWTTDIVDSYLLRLEFTSGAYATASVELHQPAGVRTTRAGCTESAVTIDTLAGTLTDARPGTPPSVLDRPTSWEPVYQEEMRAFVAALQGAPYPKTWADDRHLYDVLLAAEESARDSRPAHVAPGPEAGGS